MKRLSTNILLLCASIIFSLLILEIMLRVTPLNNDAYYQKISWSHWESKEMKEMYNNNYVYDDLIGYEKKEVYENIEEVIKNESIDYKILVLGDSVTEQRIYVDKFEALINKKYNQSIKVVNAGVIGYDTQLEYKYLKHRGIDLKPDLVLIQFNINDFPGTPVIIGNKDGSWLAFDNRIKGIKKINHLLFKNSKIYEFIILRTFSKQEKIKDWGEYKNNVKSALENMNKLLQDNSIPFYFIIIPRFEDSKTSEYRLNLIIEITEELNLTEQTLDLSPYFANKPIKEISEELYHPNEEGHMIMADALIKEINLNLK